MEFENRDAKYVAEHMFKALIHEGVLLAGFTAKDLQKILQDALEHAHPDSANCGRYVLYVP